MSWSRIYFYGTLNYKEQKYLNSKKNMEDILKVEKFNNRLIVDLRVSIEESKDTELSERFIGSFPNIKGLVVSGKSLDEVWKELLISLKVKLAYDNNLNLELISTK